jgi:hypothetical protein
VAVVNEPIWSCDNRSLIELSVWRVHMLRPLSVHLRAYQASVRVPLFNIQNPEKSSSHCVAPFAIHIPLAYCGVRPNGAKIRQEHHLLVDFQLNPEMKCAQQRIELCSCILPPSYVQCYLDSIASPHSVTLIPGNRRRRCELCCCTPLQDVLCRYRIRWNAESWNWSV